MAERGYSGARGVCRWPLGNSWRHSALWGQCLRSIATLKLFASLTPLLPWARSCGEPRANPTGMPWSGTCGLGRRPKGAPCGLFACPPHRIQRTRLPARSPSGASWKPCTARASQQKRGSGPRNRPGSNAIRGGPRPALWARPPLFCREVARSWSAGDAGRDACVVWACAESAGHRECLCIKTCNAIRFRMATCLLLRAWP